jgi:hypothetical protein
VVRPDDLNLIEQCVRRALRCECRAHPDRISDLVQEVSIKLLEAPERSIPYVIVCARHADLDFHRKQLVRSIKTQEVVRRLEEAARSSERQLPLDVARFREMTRRAFGKALNPDEQFWVSVLFRRLGIEALRPGTKSLARAKDRAYESLRLVRLACHGASPSVEALRDHEMPALFRRVAEQLVSDCGLRPEGAAAREELVNRMAKLVQESLHALALPFTPERIDSLVEKHLTARERRVLFFVYQELHRQQAAGDAVPNGGAPRAETMRLVLERLVSLTQLSFSEIESLERAAIGKLAEALIREQPTISDRDLPGLLREYLVIRPPRSLP